MPLGRHPLDRRSLMCAPLSVVETLADLWRTGGPQLFVVVISVLAAVQFYRDLMRHVDRRIERAESRTSVNPDQEDTPPPVATRPRKSRPGQGR